MHVLLVAPVKVYMLVNDQDQKARYYLPIEVKTGVLVPTGIGILV